jgi:hypothetical protein
MLGSIAETNVHNVLWLVDPIDGATHFYGRLLAIGAQRFKKVGTQNGTHFAVGLHPLTPVESLYDPPAFIVNDVSINGDAELSELLIEAKSVQHAITHRPKAQ